LRITLEYLEKLGKAGVGFVAIQQQMDYARPEGKLLLSMLGALAEFYSDNLSEEVKKGLSERKKQGLYNGKLPFGIMKGQDGLPVQDPDTYPGLVTAFDMASQGRSDREVAQVLNAKGYRSSGTGGNNPFGTRSMGDILTNRFYLGYLPDDEQGWIEGKHEPFIDTEVWDRGQEHRRRNRTSTHRYTPNGKRTWSLSGLIHCWYCGGRIHTQYMYKGQPRMGCYSRQKGLGCGQKSATLSIYEDQMLAYFKAFQIPADYQARILEIYDKIETSYDNFEAEKAKLERQLKRVKELYVLEDYSRAEYQAQKASIQKQLDALIPNNNGSEQMKTLALFLADVPAAWQAATPEQKNKLARCLYDEVWVQDKKVIGVKARPELEAFFQLNYEQSREQYIEEVGSTRVGCSLFATDDLGEIIG